MSRLDDYTTTCTSRFLTSVVRHGGMDEGGGAGMCFCNLHVH